MTTKKARDLQPGDRFILEGTSNTCVRVKPKTSRGTVEVVVEERYGWHLASDLEVELAPQTVTLEITARDIKVGDHVASYGTVTGVDISSFHLVTIKFGGNHSSRGWTFPLTVTRIS
jgi:hypothetical protein